jgi:uncharacterized membrane protein YsdA (DUF1294 family)
MLIIGYLVIVNIVAFVMFGVDKKRAINDQWRIPEKTLLGVALAGGSVGAFAGIQIFRHKTRDLKFKTLVPVFIVAHIAELSELFM